MPNNIAIQPFIILAGATPAITDNMFAQYGFLGILLSILIWYSMKSMKEARENKAEDRKERDSLIKRYEEQLKELREYNAILVTKMIDLLEEKNK